MAMRGISVVVRRPSEGTEVDSMGEPIVSWLEETVTNVLVGPSESNRIEQNGRILGTDDTLNVYVPKTYIASLKNCKMLIYGAEWSVLGDPQAFPAALCPTSWNRRVVVRKVEG